MILARVVIGNCTYSEPDKSLRMPPRDFDHNGVFFDSVRGRTKGNDVYMVYENKKAYPEYLITYLSWSRVIF